MTKEQEEQLLEHIETVRRIRDGFFSDSDIEDFCDEKGIPYQEAFDFLADKRVPACCSKCKHKAMFRKHYPCIYCSRPLSDMFEKK